MALRNAHFNVIINWFIYNVYAFAFSESVPVRQWVLPEFAWQSQKGEWWAGAHEHGGPKY